MGLLKELWEFVRVRKKYVLIPIIIALLFLGVLIFIGASAGPISPFIYAM